jgi:N-acetylglutamate synthase-like GNAT family acetyltransferase
MRDPLRICVFQPCWAEGVAELVLSIQRGEFGSPVTLTDQPDLARIPEHYQVRRGSFWVGLDGERVVGSAGVIDFGSGAALRKMFVHADYRGPANGVGQALLETALAHARAQGIEAVYLGTQERLRAARRFYERNGFRAVDPAALPGAFPRMGVDTHFYAIDTG